jgi:hypothetical protein
MSARLSLCFVLLVSAVSLEAQQLFSANPNPVQPHPGLVALFGGEPSVRVRQTTLNTNYFVNTFNNAQGELTINLFPDFVVTSKRGVVTTEGQGRYTWRGNVEGANFYGRAILAVVGNQIAGTVQKDGRTFLIRPITNNVQVVSEVNGSGFPDELTESTLGGGGNARFAVRTLAQPRRPQEVKTDTAYTIKIMLVFSDGGWIACNSGFPFGAWLPSLITLIYETNLNDVWDTFVSDTVTADVSIYCSTYTESGNLQTDIDWLEIDPTIAAERDARNADLVSMVVSTGSGCGIGNYNSVVDAGDDDRAFSVIKSSCGLSNYSLAHELGHNMGMRHDRYVESDGATSPDCNFGYTITVNGSLAGRDVMAYDDECDDAGVADCPRIAAYSYDLTISLFGFTIVFGKPCADPVAANNVTTFTASVPIVSSFR